MLLILDEDKRTAHIWMLLVENNNDINIQID